MSNVARKTAPLSAYQQDEEELNVSTDSDRGYLSEEEEESKE